MTRAEAIRAYWGVVKDCLTTFHGLSGKEAKRMTDEIRQEVESRPRRMEQDIFYNREAFNVACDLVGQEMNMLDHRDEYLRILDEHYGIALPSNKDHPPAGKQSRRRKAL